MQLMKVGFNVQAKNFDNLWSVPARRALLIDILDEWTKECREQAVLEKLMTALSAPGFLDVKLRIEKLVEKNA